MRMGFSRGFGVTDLCLGGILLPELFDRWFYL